MSICSVEFKKRAVKLRKQATHTDMYGALYKYVNGRLFHFRYYPYYQDMINLYVWGFIKLPNNHKIFPLK